MKKTLLALILVPAILIVVIEVGFNFKQLKPFDFGPFKWVHHLGNPANSIEGLKSAVEHTDMGLECDIHFEPTSERFIASHDWPAVKDAPELEDILKLIPADRKLWLDYKNADVSTVFKFSSKLKDLEAKYKLQGRYFVESPNLFHQVLLSWSGVNSVYWLQIHSKSRIAYFRELLNKLGILMADLIAVSYPIEARNPRLLEVYGRFDQLVFTVNDEKTLNELRKDSKVRATITDI